jgi:hypothetical protein
MPDLVVTCPKHLWFDWLDEGDCVGEPSTGEEWGFFLGGIRPRIERGERLYVVSWDRLRGYAPVTRVVHTDRGWAICREAGAVSCTIDNPIPGFRGWRLRWWRRSDEVPFPDWQTRGTPKDPSWQRPPRKQTSKSRGIADGRTNPASVDPERRHVTRAPGGVVMGVLSRPCESASVQAAAGGTQLGLFDEGVSDG